MTKNAFLASASRTIDLEARAIEALGSRLGDEFAKACELILQCEARVVVIGMGKSGHIGRKIAATLASTGTPAFFVHPGEASHGDMGMLTRADIVISISNSGSTAEVVNLLPLIKAMAVKMIAMTGNHNSTLAKAADVHLDVSVDEEACPLDLAPTSSTTATLVMGDALAIALLEARGFSAEDFAFSHPGGALGRRLLIKVSDVMQAGSRLPKVSGISSLKEALLEMTTKGLGITTVVDSHDSLLGVFTDGDLRRIVDKGVDLNSATAADVMNANPLQIDENRLAAEALALMEERKITALVVVDENGLPCGVVHLHDILRAEVI